MPSSDDIARWRAEAKALYTALVAREVAALNRMLAHHPKYAGRPAERLHTTTTHFQLTDAQLVVAREHGAETWDGLIESPRRWVDSGATVTTRAARISTERGDSYCGAEHLLLALAAPKQPNAASEVLTSLATGLDALRERPSIGPKASGVSLNPRALGIIAFAGGLALAESAERVTDVHVLLALAYSEPDTLVEVGADPDEVCDELALRGVRVPPLRPQRSRATRGPQNPLLCVSHDDLSAVLRLLREKHPPGTEQWGFNYFDDGCDQAYVLSEDSIDIEAIAHEALGESGAWTLRPFEYALVKDD